MTKLSSNVCVRRVRVRGGNSKFRALRLDHGNFSWGSEVRPLACLPASPPARLAGPRADSCLYRARSLRASPQPGLSGSF